MGLRRLLWLLATPAFGTLLACLCLPASAQTTPSAAAAPGAPTPGTSNTITPPPPAHEDTKLQFKVENQPPHGTTSPPNTDKDKTTSEEHLQSNHPNPNYDKPMPIEGSGGLSGNSVGAELGRAKGFGAPDVAEKKEKDPTLEFMPPPTGGESGNPILPPEPTGRDDHVEPSAHPVVVAKAVAFGGFFGVLGSLGFIRVRFRNELPGRPYGDLSKHYGRPRPKPWLAGDIDPAIFQRELALRDKFISPDELRQLRSDYLVTGNFSFSVIFPLLLAIYLFAANMTGGSRGALSLGGVLAALTSTAVTGLLCVYALDQRHRFRAEYRMLVRKGWEKSLGTIPSQEAARAYRREVDEPNGGQV